MVENKNNYNKNDTMVGKGFTITYEMLENLNKKSTVITSYSIHYTKLYDTRSVLETIPDKFPILSTNITDPIFKFSIFDAHW